MLADVGTQIADVISARDEDGDPVSTVAVFDLTAAARGDFNMRNDYVTLKARKHLCHSGSPALRRPF